MTLPGFDSWLEKPYDVTTDTCTAIRGCDRCDFVGPVEIGIVDGWEVFDCPDCGFQNETEIVYEPDPDDARDRLREKRWDRGYP